MSRYIDVSDLNIPSDENDYDELVAFADKVAEMITDAPSIDIVRCKECKFWIGHISDDDGFDEGLDECRWRDSEAPDADDFCSYGERKTNAN